MNYVCEFCENKFSSLSNLKCHKKTAKYCLTIQGENNEDYKCLNCNKYFSRKNYLDMHQSRCKKVFDPEYVGKLKNKTRILKKLLHDKNLSLIEANKQIAVLQDKLENIAVKGATKSTKTTNILQLPLTRDWLKENVQFLNKEHLKEGLYGIAKYAVNFPLKNRITVSDASRRTIKFKNDQGNTVSDVKGIETTKMICESIKIPAVNGISEIVKEKIDYLAQIVDPDNTASAITIKQIGELSDVQTGIKDISEGREHNFGNKFMAHVCEMTK